MPDTSPAGPYRTLTSAGGSAVPWYMLAFDRKGRDATRDARTAMAADLADGDYSDVFVFCHGWNNSWDDAVANYEAFITGYTGLCRERGLVPARPYRPFLVGVYWPSAILVTPGERGPGLFAGDGPDPEVAEAERQALEELASELADDDVERFHQLARKETLDGDEAEELARMLRPVYGDDDELQSDSRPEPAELVQLWSGEQDGGANLWGVLVKVRDALRQATVWLMKDRAGRVGSKALGPLLSELMQAAPGARLHLVGHSFGCRALLAAICSQPLPREVDSVLLLQGAINHLCFATDATGQGRPGGFRPALERVTQPILATFSANDASLTRFFHLALRRGSDLGEMLLVPGPPSPYAALGGYGPGGCGAECEQITIQEVGRRYQLGAGPRRILGVDGSSAISNHGDVSNPATWWALWCQVSEG